MPFDTNTTLLVADGQSGFVRSCNTVAPDADDRGWAPLGRAWKVILALIPFVCVWYGILTLRLSSRFVAPVTLAIVIYMGMTFFANSKFFVGNTTPEIAGKIFLVMLDVLIWALSDYTLSVFAALFFLRVLELWGVVERMKDDFAAVAKTSNDRIILVGFAFATFLGVVAPGGSNFVIAGSLLIKMNLTGQAADHPERLAGNRGIGAISLFGNALTSASGLLGIAINTLAEEVSPLSDDPSDLVRDRKSLLEHGAQEISRHFFVMFWLFLVIAPIGCLFLYHRQRRLAKISSRKDSVDGSEIHDERCCAGIPEIWHSMRDSLTVALLTGFAAAWGMLIFGLWIDYQLTCLAGGMLAIVVFIAWVRRSSLWPTIRDVNWRRKGHYMPFVVLITLLLLFGLIEPFEHALRGGDSQVASSILYPFLLYIDSGGFRLNRRISLLTDAGIIVIFIAFITPYIVRFREPSEETVTAIRGTGNFTEGRKGTARDNMSKAITKIRHKARVVGTFAHNAAVINQASLQRRVVLKSALKEAFGEVIPVVISISCFASMAKLMGRFGMTQELATLIGDWFHDVSGLFVVIMPLIGLIGSFLSGSTTTSVLLFGQLQVEICRSMGLIDTAAGYNSVYEVAALLILASSIGEIISPMNAGEFSLVLESCRMKIVTYACVVCWLVVITLIDGVGGNEADLIGAVWPIGVVWFILCSLTSVVFLIPKGGFN